MTHRLLVALVALALCAGPAATAEAASLDDGRPGPGARWAAGEIVLGFAPGASPEELAGRVGATVAHVSSLPGYAVVRAPAGARVPATAAALRRLPGVTSAEPNHVSESAAAPIVNDPYYPGVRNAIRAFFTDARRARGQWGLRRIGVESAWKALDGSRWADSKVAVVDSGVDFGHEELQQALLRAPDVYYPGTRPSMRIRQDPLEANPSAPSSHGTSVAGVIAAASDNGVGIAGVNPRARVLPLASQTVAETAEAFRYAADQDATIINFSQAFDAGVRRGYGVPTVQANYGMLHAAINYARDRGVLIVAAAGNESARLDSPLRGPYAGAKLDHYSLPCRDRASYSNLLCVASTDGADRLSPFSNWGREAQIAAPGSQIVLPVPQSRHLYRDFPGAAPSEYKRGALDDPDVKQLQRFLVDPATGLLWHDAQNRLVADGTFTRDGIFYAADQATRPYQIQSGTSFAAPLVTGVLSLLEACFRVPPAVERGASAPVPWYDVLLNAVRNDGVVRERRSLFGIRRTTPLRGKVEWDGRIDVTKLFAAYGPSCGT